MSDVYLSESFIEEHQPNPQLRTQYFFDWNHTCLAQQPYPQTIQQINPSLPSLTRTTNIIVSVILSDFSRNDNSRLNHKKTVLFWKEIDPTFAVLSNDLKHAINASFKSRFSNVNLTISFNPKAIFFANFFSKLNKDINKRTVVHFNLSGSHDILCSQQATIQYFYYIQLSDIIKATLHCGVHVIDCDYAGAVYSFYRESFEDMEYTTQHKCFFAFFSCSESQKLPNPPGLPTDLFSACLISAAKTVLLWHSWHYFSFKKGCLMPLTIKQVNEAPKELLDDLMTALKRTVEAMLHNHPDFIELFRTDDVVSDLVTGFVLAEHIFDFFNVTPISYPSLPPTAKSPLWSSFNLRLDAALNSLSNIHYDMSKFSFCRHSLQTIKILIESESPPSDFAEHVCFMPSCLQDADIVNEAIEVLSDVLDGGLSFIQMASKFPIFPELVRLAKDSYSHHKLVECLAKLFNFYPGAKELTAPFFTQKILNNFVVPQLRSDSPLAALVLFSLMLRSSDQITVSFFLKCNWISITECLIQSPSSEIRLWTLLFVSTFANHVQQEDQILRLFDAISNAAEDPFPTVRAAFLFSLQTIERPIDSTLLLSVLKLANDLNPAVRRELAALFVSKENFGADFPELKVKLFEDPFPFVSQTAKGHQQSLTYFSFLDVYFSPRAQNKQLPNEYHLQKMAPSELKKIKVENINFNISSNFAFSELDELIFGTNKGEIVMSTPNSGYKVIDTLQAAKITHIEYVSNYGRPFVLTSNSLGNYFAYSLKTMKVTSPILTSFNVDLNSNSQKFELAPHDSKLYCYSPGGETVKLCNLSTEQMVNIFTSNTNGHLSGVHAFPHLSDCILICDDSLYIYDCRTMTPMVTIKQPSKIFDCQTFKREPYLVPICTNDGNVLYYDIRVNQPLKVFKSVVGDVQPLSLDVQEATLSAAVGNTKGVSAYDFINEKVFHYPYRQKHMKPIHQIKWLPKRYGLIMTQTNNDIISWAES